MTELKDDIRAIYAGRAHRRYGLSDVSQLQHALQAAALAEAEGAPPALIVAALLHDVGHMIHDLGDNPAGAGVDDHHEELGADWLAARFGAEVAEPVRLHVAAKRFLCAAEPAYAAALSADSRLSLGLQGGAMSAAEAQAFLERPFAGDAVRLRRWDDAAKDPDARVPDLDHVLRHLDASSAGSDR
jgi:phosphonate degradation associated HDIG domain protein